MRSLHVLFFVLIVCSFSPVQAQEDYEDLLETDGSVLDPSELLERIDEIRKHPMDINTASAVELQRIPWLSPVQAHQIVKYRKNAGPFLSVRHLLKVPGLDESTLEKIVPLITVEAGPRFPSVSGRIRARVIHGGSREEMQEADFLFREKVYTRGEFNVSDRMTFQVLTEKDPGERSLDDHAVYSLLLHRYRIFDEILFGHFRLDFGQGLVLGDYSGSFTGAAFPLSLKKRERGLKAYTSTFEACPLFGLACSGSVKNISYTLFGSKADVDATLNDDGTVSSIYDSGLHRTENEREKRNVLKENLCGGHVSYPLRHVGQIGATYYHSRYSRPFDPKDLERKHFTFRGRANSVGGLNFDAYCQRLNLFGEAAKAFGAGYGTVIGAVVDFTKIEIGALVRAYSWDFYNLRNYAFAQDPSETKNESGTFVGLKYQPNRDTRFRAYVDRVRNPWRRYYEKMPTGHEEFWSQVEHTFTRNILTTIRIRVKTKETNKKINESESKITPRRQINIRGQIDGKCSKEVHARVRLERVWVDYPDLTIRESGWLLFGDLRLGPVKWFALDNRIIFFETDSYDSRVYEYENDLPGTMTNLGLYEQGWRWYVLGKIKTGRTLRLSMKYSVTRSYREKKDDCRFGVQLEVNPIL